jgi:hypothetical protein
MKPYTLPLAVLLCLSPSVVRAEIHVGIQLGLPPVPQMVVVSPGIQVVEGFQDEVFFQGGWYWCRRPDGWYRARNPQAHFDWIESRRVPGGLSRMPSGRYRNWHHDGGPRGMRNDMRNDMRGHDMHHEMEHREMEHHEMEHRGEEGEHRH